MEVSLSLSLTLITLVRALSARAAFFYELYRVIVPVCVCVLHPLCSTC